MGAKENLHMLARFCRYEDMLVHDKKANDSQLHKTMASQLQRKTEP